MNDDQHRLYKDRWYQNTILKARQKGFSTLVAIFMLDCCLFDTNVSCGIIDITLDDAVAKLNKIRFAYERIPRAIRDLITLNTNNSYEMTFANGSNISVGTSHRGGTLQILHISEYGKICAKFPERAREIRTGALNTIQSGQLVFVESTAEGQEGGFYSICQAAQAKQRLSTPLTPLDFKFHFFPWWTSHEYSLDVEGVRERCPNERISFTPYHLWLLSSSDFFRTTITQSYRMQVTHGQQRARVENALQPCWRASVT